jgi:predicted ABC-type sugar transport system permease subunit
VFFTAPGMFFVAYSGATALSLHSVIAAAGLLYALCSGALSINVVGLEVLCFLAASLTGLLTGVLVSIIAPMRSISPPRMRSPPS